MNRGITEYPHVVVCEKSLVDDTVYENFKSIPEYTQILQHCPLDVAERCLTKIVNHAKFASIPWYLIGKNDTIGNPELHDFTSLSKKIILPSYKFSTTTILYLYQALCILDSYKVSFSVTEIGCGYGGLCYILHVLAPIFDKTITNYTLIDLPVVSEHQKKYLTDIGIYGTIANLRFVHSDKLKEIKSDLVISIYALGEFPNTVANEYIEKVVKKSTNYYIWWNITPVEQFPYFANAIREKTGLNIDGYDLILRNF